MKDKDYSVIESLGRINRFAINHLAAFPTGSQALTDGGIRYSVKSLKLFRAS